MLKLVMPMEMQNTSKDDHLASDPMDDDDDSFLVRKDPFFFIAAIICNSYGL